VIVREAAKKILLRERLMEIVVKTSIAKVRWRANGRSRLEDRVNLAFSPSDFLLFHGLT